MGRKLVTMHYQNIEILPREVTHLIRELKFPFFKLRGHDGTEVGHSLLAV